MMGCKQANSFFMTAVVIIDGHGGLGFRIEECHTVYMVHLAVILIWRI